MATKKTASKAKVKTSGKATKPAAKTPVKLPGKKKQGIKKGSSFSCEVCGLIVSVDEVCGCVETCDILCCGEQMTKKK